MKVKKILSFVVFLTVLMTLFCSSVSAENSNSINTDNTTLDFSKVMYIDVTNGDDTLGDGSISTPYKTVDKAFLNATDNSCIYIKAPGTYTIPNGLQSIINPSLKITYFVPVELRGKATFALERNSLSYNQVQKQTTTFIGLRFIKEKSSYTKTYEYWFNGANLNLEFQNCLFDSVNNVPSQYVITTGNSNPGCTITKLNYINCTFIPNFSQNTSASGLHRGSFINCAFLKSNFTENEYNLCGCTFDQNYNITNITWKNIGTGTNSDGSIANIGVHGGAYSWGDTVSEPPINSAVTFEVSSVDKAKTGDEITSDIIIHNATNICAEDLKIAYDTSKLQFISAENADGMKIYKEDDIAAGIKRYITACLGKANAANGDKILMRLKFKAIDVGEAKIDIANGRIADNSTLEMDVAQEYCGEKIILIEGVKDVNRTGEYTLLDLGIDAWYYGVAVADIDTTKYNADQIINGTIDDEDLSEIVAQMLNNSNYPANK